MRPEQDSSETVAINGKDYGFIDYIESRDPQLLPKMLAERSIPSLLHTIRQHGISDFSDKTVKVWIVDMLIDGMKESSIKRYTGAMHTLYKEWADTTKCNHNSDAFSISLTEFDTESSCKYLKEIEENLDAAARLTKQAVKPESASYIYIKSFQYLLFNPFATLREIVNLKFSDPIPESLHLEDIVTSMRDAPQAKYVFPLKQGKRREPAIIKDLLVQLHATARRQGLKFGTSFSRDSITSLWIATAIKEDITYEEIRGMIENLPEAYSFLSLIDPVDLSEERKKEILNIVAYAITNKNPGWFVLRLRSGVTPDKIKERLKDKRTPLERQIRYYYPTRTVKRIEKKKLVTDEMPVIPGLLFIRLPHDMVGPLMGLIGDLAWCYRTSANPTSPYSVIPQSEMRIFQRCVGAFTEDVEMDIVSELPELSVGDSVIIEDGSHLDGQVAVIQKMRNVDGTLTYTLRLSDTAFIKWKDVSLPASYLSKRN